MIFKRSVFLFTLWMVFLLAPGYSQDTYFKFDRITTESGLPQEHIFCILQDREGFLWFGTEMGLVRYDGYNFRVFRHDPNDPHSISSNIIKAIHEDENGTLWIGTDGGGLCRFDTEQEVFTTYKNRPDDPGSLSGNRVYAISEDKAGNLWVGTLGSGLNKLVFEDREATSLPQITRYQYDPGNPESLADDNIWTMLIDDANRLWIGTIAGGLNRLELEEEASGTVRFYKYKNDPSDPHSISSNSIKAIYEDPQSTLWIGTEFRGLNRFDESTQTFTRFEADPDDPHSLSHNYVNAILEDQSGNCWVGTNGGGVNLLNKESGRFTVYRHSARDPYSLNGNLVNTIYEDRSGIIWFGMVNHGLNLIDPEKQLIKHYYSIEGKTGSLTGNLVKSIMQDSRGNIWVGSFGGGLNLFDPERGTFRQFFAGTENGKRGAIKNVQTIFEDSRGDFWIGTDGGGLYLFDREKHKFTPFNPPPAANSNLSFHSVWTICEDIRGDLWIGTADGGLNRYDREAGVFHNYHDNPDDPNTINSNDVRVVFEDHLGILWIGTYGGGLNQFNPVRNEFAHYKNNPGDSNSISNDIITDIFESPTNKELWVGTFGGGVNRFDRTTGAFEAFREKDGLSNDVVKSIEEDGEGNLWISTLKGISRFNPEQRTFLNFTTSDGLQGDAFNLGASCFTTEGEMYFGGTKGFNVFDPSGIEKRQEDAPPCLLTDVKVFNRSIQPGEQIGKKVLLKKAIHNAEEIVIPYHVDDFVFEFAALDFTGGEEVRYAFMMEGQDDKWHYTDAERRYAPYSNLDPGDYTFKVKATTGDGSWNTQAAVLKVQVLSAPWETGWAYVFYGLVIIGLIWVARHFTLSRWKLLNELKLERLERKKIRELNEMKLRFFTNISHEIRTPLTLIAAPLESLISSDTGDRESRQHLQTMRRNVNRLLLLVNQLLEFRKQQSGHANVKAAKGDFVEFIQEIILSFKEFARQKSIDLIFDHRVEAVELWFDRDMMEKVFFNLLSNAFKFTEEGGQVKVLLEEEEAQLKVTVEDNGKGIAKEDLPFVFDRFYKFDSDYTGSQLGSGIGLALTRSLVKLHHGQIRVESEPRQFTRFVLTLPKGAAHFSGDQVVESFRTSEDVTHYQASELREPAEMREAPPDLAPDAPTLLLVEDNEGVRHYLKEIFYNKYRIFEAGNGKEGLELAREESPDLIISDIMMPEVDGIEFCRQVKTNIETSHIPVILLTARTSLLFCYEGLDTGADDYITKPFNPTLLEKRAANLIEQRKKLRKKFSEQIKIAPSEVALTPPDADLLEKAIRVVEEHISDAEFDVSQFAREMGVSRPVLYRKLPALTDYTPLEFIRAMRLKRAAQLLSQDVLSVSEVCYSIGFKTPKYFSKCFRKEFGVSPSEFMRSRSEGRGNRVEGIG